MEVLACQDIGELCEDLRAAALRDRMGQGRALALSEGEVSGASAAFRRHPAATALCPVRALPGSPRRANVGTGWKGFLWREGLANVAAHPQPCLSGGRRVQRPVRRRERRSRSFPRDELRPLWDLQASDAPLRLRSREPRRPSGPGRRSLLAFETTTGHLP